MHVSAPIGGLMLVHYHVSIAYWWLNACARKHMGCINACARKHSLLVAYGQRYLVKACARKHMGCIIVCKSVVVKASNNDAFACACARKHTQ